MSESTGAMEQFNINELAGATGLILGAVGGILAIIFKSRCFCKFRIGISDRYSLCMCERKPPPDPEPDAHGSSDEESIIPNKEDASPKVRTEGAKEEDKDPKTEGSRKGADLPYPDETP